MTTTWRSTHHAERYHRLQYLARYYRWLSTHGPEIGARCPMTGKPYTQGADTVHRRAHKVSARALAREYILAAREYRQHLETVYTHNTPTR